MVRLSALGSEFRAARGAAVERSAAAAAAVATAVPVPHRAAGDRNTKAVQVNGQGRSARLGSGGGSGVFHSAAAGVMTSSATGVMTSTVG